MHLYKKIAIALAASAALALAVTGVAAAAPGDPQHCVARVDLPRDRAGDQADYREKILRLHLLCKHYQSATAAPASPAAPAPQEVDTTVVPEAPVPTVVEGGPAVTH